MPTKDEVNKFSLVIEDMVSSKKIPYMDAIILHCSVTGLEIEVASKLISPILKKKIEHEARTLNFLPKHTSNRLPITRS